MTRGTSATLARTARAGTTSHAARGTAVASALTRTATLAQSRGCAFAAGHVCVLRATALGEEVGIFGRTAGNGQRKTGRNQDRKTTREFHSHSEEPRSVRRNDSMLLVQSGSRVRQAVEKTTFDLDRAVELSATTCDHFWCRCGSHSPPGANSMHVDHAQAYHFELLSSARKL